MKVAIEPAVIESFRQEYHSFIPEIESNLVDLARDGASISRELSARISRRLFCIAAAAKFCGLASIAQLCRALKNILSEIGNERLPLSNDLMVEIFSAIDRLKILIEEALDIERYDVEEELTIPEASTAKTDAEENMVVMYERIQSNVSVGESRRQFEISQTVLTDVAERGLSVYSVAWEFQERRGSEGRKIFQCLNETQALGEFIDLFCGDDSIMKSEGEPDSHSGIFILFATQLEKDLIHIALEVDSKRINPLSLIPDAVIEDEIPPASEKSSPLSEEMVSTEFKSESLNAIMILTEELLLLRKRLVQISESMIEAISHIKERVKTEKPVYTPELTPSPKPNTIFGLSVIAEGQRFIIPKDNLREIIRVTPGERKSSIELRGDREALRLKDDLLPLIRLNRILGLETANSAKTKAGSNGDRRVKILVLSSAASLFGLIVDEVEDLREIALKPLPQILEKNNYFSGAALMEDGSVALVLEVESIEERATAR